MKKALLLTDCSIDLALSLQRWLETQPDPIHLTILQAFTLPNQPLTATTFKTARQEALEKNSRWLDMLPTTSQTQVSPKLLFGNPTLVVTLHLLLRQYDYLLIDMGQQEVLSAFVSCQSKIDTEVRWLGLPEASLYPRDLVHKLENRSANATMY